MPSCILVAEHGLFKRESARVNDSAQHCLSHRAHVDSYKKMLSQV